jgi:hypothetical protein
VAAKIKDFKRQNSAESKHTPKHNIVDTNLHAFCTPGIIQTNNTAFLPYGASTTNKRVDGIMKLMNTILRGLTMLLLANELMDTILRILTTL